MVVQILPPDAHFESFDTVPPSCVHSSAVRAMAVEFPIPVSLEGFPVGRLQLQPIIDKANVKVRANGLIFIVASLQACGEHHFSVAQILIYRSLDVHTFSRR